MLRGSIISIAALAIAATPALAQNAPSDAGAAAGTKLGMRELNNSGQTGFVTLFSHGTSETLVIVNITAPSGSSEFAHIHRGRTQPDQENSCDNLDPKPAYVLHPVVNGRSATLVKASEDKLLSGNYVINVHAQNDVSRYVSCGELNR
jgi:hypothetical protein